MIRLFWIIYLLWGFPFFSSAQSSPFHFPQGVASGDPQPNAVTLWTRVESQERWEGPIDLTVEVARDRAFKNVILTDHIKAESRWDHTVRYYAQPLASGQRYYYRFIASNDTSMIGRTLTAPDPLKSAPLNLGMLACQSFEQGFYGTLARMIEEDKAAPDSEQLELIIHLGDFIYEVVGDDPRNDNHQPTWLIDRFGKEREIPPFPQGIQRLDIEGEWKSGSTQPFTVEDYRHLYKVYLSNPVMKEARARWPFICTWDDHEFANGCYQSISPATKKIGLEGMQTMKVAANQAWFEFIPAALDHASVFEGIESYAHDFIPTQVKNVPIGDSLMGHLFAEPNNLRAIESMCIYRSLTWGKDIQLFITDNKSYQLPGTTALGDQQKEWFLTSLEQSTAQWKLWINSEPFGEVALDFDAMPELGLGREVLYHDSWVVNAQETQEIKQYLHDRHMGGVVCLSGDYHIQMANTIYYEQQPVMVDFSVTSMSAFADFFWLDRKGKGYGNEKIERIFSFSTVEEEKRANINVAARFGVKAAYDFALTEDQDILKRSPDTINPGLEHFDCRYNGYIQMTVDKKEMKSMFVNTQNARVDYEERGAPMIYKEYYRLPAWKDGESPALNWEMIEVLELKEAVDE